MDISCSLHSIGLCTVIGCDGGRPDRGREAVGKIAREVDTLMGDRKLAYTRLNSLLNLSGASTGKGLLKHVN